jgi:hypothetical protein
MARARTWTIGLAAAAVAAAGLGAPAGAAKPSSGSSTGTARIFQVNPVQSSGDQSLVDAKDSATAVPASEYVDVPLTHLDGSGYLRGDYAVVESSTGTPAFSPSNTFLYNRHDDQFEQTMAYFWVTQAQTYLHELGFGESLPGVVDQPFPVKIDQYGGDNSYQTDKPYRIRLGKGGVDDAEDAEVIVHEYGHAVHASQVPGYGASLDAGSIGEAFGDYLGVSVGLDAAAQYRWPVRTDPACVADWDSVSYTDAPHCLRTLHENLTVAQRRGEVHYDGQIWSQALWESRLGYQSLGLSARDWDTTLIDSQFGYAPDTSFSAAAATTYATALRRDGRAAANVVRAAFAARGITF